jgi:hypothetical protein
MAARSRAEICLIETYFGERERGDARVTFPKSGIWLNDAARIKSLFKLSRLKLVKM